MDSSATKKTTTKEKSPRYATCDGCGYRLETKKLYRVRDRDICLSCGDKEIEEWNAIIRQVNA